MKAMVLDAPNSSFIEKKLSMNDTLYILIMMFSMELQQSAGSQRMSFLKCYQKIAML